MKDIVKQMFYLWYSNGGDLFNYYNDVGGFSIYGSWGSIENMTMNLAQSPKYQALMEVVALQTAQASTTGTSSGSTSQSTGSTSQSTVSTSQSTVSTSQSTGSTSQTTSPSSTAPPSSSSTTKNDENGAERQCIGFALFAFVVLAML